MYSQFTDFFLGASANGLNVRWKKAFKEEDKILQDDASKTIALSSFMLTTLPTSMAQKTMIQEMWDSGAHTIVRESAPLYHYDSC